MTLVILIMNSVLITNLSGIRYAVDASGIVYQLIYINLRFGKDDLRTEHRINNYSFALEVR